MRLFNFFYCYKAKIVKKSSTVFEINQTQKFIDLLVFMVITDTDSGDKMTWNQTQGITYGVIKDSDRVSKGPQWSRG